MESYIIIIILRMADDVQSSNESITLTHTEANSSQKFISVIELFCLFYWLKYINLYENDVNFISRINDKETNFVA